MAKFGYGIATNKDWGPALSKKGVWEGQKGERKRKVSRTKKPKNSFAEKIKQQKRRPHENQKVQTEPRHKVNALVKKKKKSGGTAHQPETKPPLLIEGQGAKQKGESGGIILFSAGAKTIRIHTQ